MLCLSILFVNCLYIPFSLIKPNLLEKGRISLCNIVGFLFHYFFLTSFTWMLIMAIIQYMHFVRIFNSHVSHFFLKTAFIGWILPLIFPILVLFISTNGGYTGELRCWINDPVLLYVTFLTPVAVILLCNLILFILTLKSICRRDLSVPIYQKNRSKLQMGAALCCCVSIGKEFEQLIVFNISLHLGCAWIFGILVLIRPLFIHQLLFCICNSLQGCLIFIFHVYLSKPKRELWQTFFIQHGLHQRPHISSGHTGLMTTRSDSSAGNISSLTRPVKFRFTSGSLSSDQQGTFAAINPTFIEHNGNGSSSKEQIQTGRGANLIIRTSQPEFLYERIRRAKMEANNNYG
jgi:hypothetical protein